MATRRVEFGPTGRTVAILLTHYRKRQGFTMRELAEVLAQRQWTLSASAISQIENGARRVDVDDLVALADALDVSPMALLGVDEQADRPVREVLDAVKNLIEREVRKQVEALNGDD